MPPQFRDLSEQPEYTLYLIGSLTSYLILVCLLYILYAVAKIGTYPIVAVIRIIGFVWKILRYIIRFVRQGRWSKDKVQESSLIERSRLVDDSPEEIVVVHW
ncbi:TPA_asm: P6 [Ipomoea betacytorhabdovirus 1]|nr:TPA_asm: P6 [Ipomoea betacytorhabdovirus 1]